jgi:hypothetical protein
MAPGQGVSLKPSDAVAGGGMFDDVDVEIVKCRFRSWDYNGKIQTPILGLEVTYRNPEDGFEFSQVYSAGEMKQFVPSEDGRFAVPVGSQAGLNDQSNAIFYITAFVNAGFPENKIGDDVSVFEGAFVHVNNVPQPKRKGQTGTGADGKPNMILIPTKVMRWPWDPKPAPTAASAAPKVGKTKAAPAVQQAAVPAEAPAAAAAPAASAGGEDVESKAMSAIMSILSAKGGSISKAALAQAVFAAVKTDPDRNAIVSTAFKDEFLKQGPWSFDGSTISLG